MSQDKRFAPRTGLREIGWFIALWAGGVGTVGIVAMLIKAILG